MQLRKIIVGKIKTNCYIVTEDSGETFVVDPGGDAQEIIQELEKTPNLDVRYILLTHAHYDHILAVDDLKFKYPKADVILGEGDVSLYHNLPIQGLYAKEIYHRPSAEVYPVSDGSFLPFGDDVIKVIHTPGHSKGGVCYLFSEVLFSGDTIFYHTYGRTDLPEASDVDIKTSIYKLMALPKTTFVYPGHGKPTSIGEEKEFYGIN